MVEGIADNGVIGAQYGFEEAAIGVETRGIEDGVFGSKEGANAGLEFLVNGLRATDKADRCHAVAELVERLVCGGDYIGMVGEAQVVVGAEVEHVLAAAVHTHVYVGLLRARD
jgi:hypothetical protein